MAIRSRALACALLGVLVVALIVAAPVAGKGKPTKPTTEFGNNLSVPVIFAEGYNIVGGDVSDVGSGFRSSALVDNFDALTVYSPLEFLGVTDPDTGLTVDLAGNLLLSNWFYEQKTEAMWQAEWVDATDPDTSMTTVDVTRLDWGDSLLAKTWPVTAKIRLEIRLYRENDLLNSDGSPGLRGYGMNHLSGAGIDEVWGAADASPIDAAEALGDPCIVTPAETTVYSNCARLSLYALDAAGNPVDPELFDGDGMAVADKYGTDGPGLFGAEVNVGGYVLYGYTLDGKAMGLKAGKYRVIFSLDPEADWAGGSVEVDCNTWIAGLDPSDEGPSEWPYYSQLAEDGLSSWVDFELVPKTSGGGGGGKPH